MDNQMDEYMTWICCMQENINFNECQWDDTWTFGWLREWMMWIVCMLDKCTY